MNASHSDGPSSDPRSGRRHPSGHHRRKRRRKEDPGRYMDEGRSLKRRKGSKLHRRPGDPEDRQLKANLILCIGYLVTLLAYGLVLTFFAGRKPAAQPVAAPAPAVVEPEAPREPPASLEDAKLLAADEARRITERIDAWERASLYLEEGFDFIEKGKTDRAEARLNKAQELTSRNMDVHLALTQLYIAQKRYDEAKNSLLTLLEINPEHDKGRIMLAQILSTQRNHDGALAVANWILKTDPFSLEANKAAATAYLQTDRPAAAAPHLRKIVNMDRDDLLARNNLAVAYSRMGQFEKAIEILEKLLKEDASNSITYYNMAVCYAQYNKPVFAIEILNRASERFGAAFVRTWMESHDFDPIRDHAQFAILVQLVGQGGGGASSPNTVVQKESLQPQGEEVSKESKSPIAEMAPAN